ncbi:MAG: trypsin-like peptidase domain-containing protein [Thermodesulfobacteriota bacterium]
MTRNRIHALVTLSTFICLFVCDKAIGGRKIPDDNLGYPVHIILPTGNSGSGFFVNTDNASYLVTASHIFFDKKTNRLISDTGECRSYGKDPNDQGRLILSLNLKTLLSSRNLLYHSSHDVTVLKIGVRSNVDNTVRTNLTPGIKLISVPKSGMVGVGLKGIKKYDAVLTANEIIIFGYPSSIGLKQIPQIDYEKPLLRVGIIAGKNNTKRTIIIDCPVYHGNSGGPVLEIEEDGLEKHFNAIGVVTEFIPAAEYWKNETNNYANLTLTNSGYAVVEPMDYVLELINSIETVK